MSLAARLATESPGHKSFAAAVANSDFEDRHPIFAAHDGIDVEAKALKWSRPEAAAPVFNQSGEGLGL